MGEEAASVMVGAGETSSSLASRKRAVAVAGLDAGDGRAELQQLELPVCLVLEGEAGFHQKSQAPEFRMINSGRQPQRSHSPGRCPGWDSPLQMQC